MLLDYGRKLRFYFNDAYDRCGHWSGILGSIAIPNFLRWSGKSKQSEAKANLGAIFYLRGEL